MERDVNTISAWRPKPGRETEFVSTWEALREAFNKLPNPPARPSALIKSPEEPDLYYCFGTWRSIADVEAAKEDPDTQMGLYALRQLCMEFSREAFALWSGQEGSSGQRQETELRIRPRAWSWHRSKAREMSHLLSSVATGA